MTEISLTMSMGFLGLMLAGGLMRWVLAHHSDQADQRLLTAVLRAASSFSFNQQKRTALAVLALIGVASIAGPGLDWFRPQLTVWLGIGLVCGAGFSALAGQIALQLGVRAAASAAGLLRVTPTASVLLALRSGTAIGLGVETMTLLLSVGCLAVVPAASGSEQTLATVTAPLFAGIALGTVASALVAQLTGGALASAGEAGRHETSLGAPRFPFQLDARNPTMVLSAVSKYLSPLAVRVQDTLAASFLSHVICLLAAISAAPTAQSLEEVPLSLLALPLLLRASSMLGSAFALFSVRIDEADDNSSALYRAHLAAALIVAAGLVGTCRWLLGNQYWLGAAGTALLGLLGHTAISQLTRLRLERRSKTLVSLREVGSQSPEGGVLQSLATAGIAGASHIVFLGVLLAFAITLGATEGFAGGSSLAVGLSLSGFFSLISFSLALGMLEPVLGSASGFVSLSQGTKNPQKDGRLASLDAGAFAASSVAQVHFAGGGALIAWTLAALFTLRVMPQPDTGPILAVMALSGFAGAAVVLTYCATMIRHAVRAASAVLGDLAQQFRSFARSEQGKVELPPDFSPGYKDQLSRATTNALARIGGPLAAAVLLPLVLGALVAKVWGGETFLHSLIAFLTIAAFTALVLGSFAEGSAATLGTVRRQTRTPSARQQAALHSISRFAAFFGNVAPASYCVVKGAAAACLTLAAIFA